jgi:hypothetical protein
MLLLDSISVHLNFTTRTYFRIKIFRTYVILVEIFTVYINSVSKLKRV